MQCLPRLVALLLGLSLPAAAADPVTVFGAASLSNAMEAIGQAYGNRTGEVVRFSFASSSTLARQIEAGAPAQAFCSASEPWMDYLAERGLIDAASRVSPVGNTLVLVAPQAAGPRPLTVDAGLDLARLLGPDGRLAVGDPAHVPAGIYARQALQALGQWPALRRRLAPADNVRAALALVERGEAPLGIVYATDAAISPAVVAIGTFPEGSHPPISYPCAVIKDQGSDATRRFFGFLTGPDGLAIFARFGFTPN
jgi:molybdate transport system substrate-binding protein